MGKNHCSTTLELFCAKNRSKKPNFREMRELQKSTILKRLQPMQSLQALQNGNFASKIKNAKNMKKNHSTRTLELFCAKNRSKNTKYRRNLTILKMGGLGKAIAHSETIAFCKMVSLGQKLKVEEDDRDECTPYCAKQSNDTNFDVFTCPVFCFQVAITLVLLSTKILEMKWEARSQALLSNFWRLEQLFAVLTPRASFAFQSNF